LGRDQGNRVEEFGTATETIDPRLLDIDSMGKGSKSVYDDLFEVLDSRFAFLGIGYWKLLKTVGPLWCSAS
jgi:hypothetical protein